MSVSIVIPAYNEENNIGIFLSRLVRYFPSMQIIVVCNGCTDRTPEIVEGLKRRYKNIRMLVYKEKIGKGAAILEGFKRSKGEYVGFVDADGAFSCKDIKRVLKALRWVDCAIASKWKGKHFSSVKVPLERKILSRSWNLLVRFFLHLNLEDTQAGLKFVKKEVINSIDLNFICKGFDFDVEFLSKIRRKGFKIKEIPTDIKSNKKTSFSFFNIPKMFINLLRLSLKI